MESNLGNIPSLNMFQINDRATLDRSEKVATFAANFHLKKNILDIIAADNEFLICPDHQNHFGIDKLGWEVPL
jgi:hypothetical protein